MNEDIKSFWFDFIIFALRLNKMTSYGLLVQFHCANEDKVCYCEGTVIFGKGNKWTDPKKANDGSIACTVAVFGDPFRDHIKTCLCTLSSMANANLINIPEFIKHFLH